MRGNSSFWVSIVRKLESINIVLEFLEKITNILIKVSPFLCLLLYLLNEKLLKREYPKWEYRYILYPVLFLLILLAFKLVFSKISYTRKLDEFQKGKQDELDNIAEKYKQELDNLRIVQESELRTLKQNGESEINRIRSNYAKEILALRDRTNKELKEILKERKCEEVNQTRISSDDSEDISVLRAELGKYKERLIELDQLYQDVILRDRLKYEDQISEEQFLMAQMFCELLVSYSQTIVRVEQRIKQIDNGDCTGITFITHDIFAFLDRTLSNLTNLFSKLTGHEISACIKVIAYFTESHDPTNAFVQTLIRSKNSHYERLDGINKLSKLSENTALLEIVNSIDENHNAYYYRGNLISDYDKNDLIRYVNTNHDWQKYYRGTIVVPIGMDKSSLNYGEKGSGYQIIGFLCVDTLSTEAFTSDRESQYTFVVKSFASVIFNVLNGYSNYLHIFEDKGNSVKEITH